MSLQAHAKPNGQNNKIEISIIINSNKLEKNYIHFEVKQRRKK